MHVSLHGVTSSNHGGVGVTFNGVDSDLADVVVFGTGCSAMSLSGGNSQTLSPSGLSLTRANVSHYARVSRTYEAGVGWYGVGIAVSDTEVSFAPHTGESPCTRATWEL